MIFIFSISSAVSCLTYLTASRAIFGNMLLKCTTCIFHIQNRHASYLHVMETHFTLIVKQFSVKGCGKLPTEVKLSRLIRDILNYDSLHFDYFISGIFFTIVYIVKYLHLNVIRLQ